MDTPAWATTAIAAVAGLLIGGYVSVLITWLAGGAPGLRRPAARCPHAEAPLGRSDLIPPAGWLRLRRRCPECASSLGGSWLAAELLTAAVFAGLAARFGPSPVLPAFCYLGAVGVALAFIDARYQRLPDVATLPSYPVALLLLGVAALTTAGGARHFLVAVIGLAGTWLLFVLQALIYPAGVGWGDVKLSGIVGLYLGWLGLGALVAGLFLSYLLAAIAGLALLATQRASRKSQLAFGPFLLAGTLIVVLASGLVVHH
jgi:leader peptidase (prepilin peptidase) / N-methyltransferase